MSCFKCSKVKKVLMQLQKLTGNEEENHVNSRVQDASVQTDFPVEMLEDYVVKNRKRILKLLGLSNNCGTKQFYLIFFTFL